jgi:hypothetical protein
MKRDAIGALLLNSLHLSVLVGATRPNVFNTNAEQTLNTSSGGSWLRPTAITRPRVLRIGARLEW